MSKMNSKKLRAILGEYGIIAVLILLVIVFACLSDRFLLLNNIFNILRQAVRWWAPAWSARRF